MFTIYNGEVYKVNGNKMVGVEITPTSLKTVKGTEIKTPILNNVLTLREVKIKYHIGHGKSYKFPTPKKKVDKDEPTTKTKKATGKSK